MSWFSNLQLIGIDFFAKLLRLGTAWYLELGRLLTLAQVTWLEIPSPAQLIAAHMLLKSSQTNKSHAHDRLVFKVGPMFCLCSGIQGP